MVPPPPAWVQALKPAGPQGSELLQKERAQSHVPVDKLAELIHSKPVLERQEKLLSVLQSDPVFDKSQNYSLGRVERIQRALAKGKRLQQLSVEQKWSADEYYAAADLIAEPTPYGLHATMFLVRKSPHLLNFHSYIIYIQLTRYGASRSLFESRELQSSTSSSCTGQRSTRSSDAMRRRSWATARTSAVSRPPRPGAPRTRPSSSTRPA